MRSSALSRPKTPQIDMTPMVDMAFLLVTFFLLATTFKTGEIVWVQMPRSVAGLNLPMTDLLTVFVDKDGRAYLSLTSPPARRAWLQRHAQVNQVQYTEEEYRAFEMMSGFGVPSTQLRELLQKSPEERKRFVQTGIPAKVGDKNELADWIILARATIPRLRIAIKADATTPYKKVEDVIKTLTDINVLRFTLITQPKKLDDDAGY
ncbi:MAG: biopolymer transporter ExbD [Saprospiraceae bacterium]|nr:biopolymer transporter ExbD [Saprospiraceae bacterium]MDW8228522.1 biopolymer transporter ExbD [Saprospiraceae bacterium]